MRETHEAAVATSPVQNGGHSPESSIGSYESWREYVQQATDPRLTCREWERWMEELGYALVQKNTHLEPKEVMICQYGRVAHLNPECRFLRKSSFKNWRIYPICGECQGLEPGDRDSGPSTAKGGANILM